MTCWQRIPMLQSAKLIHFCYLFAHILHFNTNDHETVDDDADSNPRCQEVEPSLHVPEGQRVDCTSSE